MTNPNENGHVHSRERVLTEDLAGVLQTWKDRYEAERPTYDSRRYGAKGARKFFGSMQYITTHSGVSPRRIWGILQKETKTTSYWLADQILTPLGLQNALEDGRIRSADKREYGPVSPATNKRKSDPAPYMSKLKQPGYMSNERWFEFLDQIGCRR